MPKLGELKRGWEIGIKKTQRGNKFIWIECPECGKQRWVSVKGGKPVYLYCRSCCNRRDRSCCWKGGKYKTRGYNMVTLTPNDFFYSMAYKRDGYVLEHRYIMAKHLGRCLHRWEIVHHKNGIRDDNRIENLELAPSLYEHIKNHSLGYGAGYKAGLLDGRNKQIQLLKAEIKHLLGGKK